MPGEDAAIDVERARLAAVDQLSAAARAAEDALYGGDDSARDRVAVAAREVERAARTRAFSSTTRAGGCLSRSWL